MTGRVHTTEIEIFGFTDIAKVIPQKTDIDYVIKPFIDGTIRTENVSEIEISSFGFAPISSEDRIIEIDSIADQVNVTTKHGKVVTENYFGFADVPLLVLENDPISDYSDNSFDESPGISFSELIPPTFYRIEVQPLKDVVAFMPLEEISGRLEKVLNAYADLKLSFYSEILEMTNRVHTTEIEILSTVNLPLEFGREIKLNLEVQQDASSDFNVRIVPYGDVPIEEFENNQIQSIELLTFDLEFSNLNITKNVFIDGTVSFIDPGLSAIQVIRFKNDSIESLENTNFEDESGFKVAGVGINTTFTDDFLVGDALITSTEKFLVTAVANNEYLEINVNPEENYDDVSVYREYFV
jgi:hypothetical protein